MTNGELDLFLIKNECYLDVVHAEPLPPTQYRQGLSFNIFKQAGSDQATQDITCSVRLCGEVCTRRSDDDGCQNEGDIVYSSRETDLA